MIGFAIGAILALVVGAAVGLSRRVEALLGKLSDSLLCWLELRLLSWRDVFDSRPA